VTAIPIVRLEVDGMKHSILQALSTYATDLSEEIKSAVERFCTPENIQAVIDREVHSVISRVVGEEVDRFYRSGAGRAVISQAVQERLGRP
jgi:hypothetical protein